MKRNMVGFATWQALLSHLDGPSPDREVRWVWYHAPLDVNPRLVRVARRFKNGKLRIDPTTNEADSFTADAGHLPRFFRVADAPEFLRADLETP